MPDNVRENDPFPPSSIANKCSAMVKNKNPIKAAGKKKSISEKICKNTFF
jgi:hypothetical protein